MSTIEIKGICKRYGSTLALDNVDLTLEPNRIYGLLGRNGAGKTTLLNLISNKIFPTQGEIVIDGANVLENDQALSKIFYMMEASLYPSSLRVKEAFRWSKEFYPDFDMNYALNLSEKFGLNMNKRVKELSTGYGSIMKAIIALASNASIVIFDEPVLGLDANHREMFYRELVASYSLRPKTIIISTHLIEEISEVLEEVIIIKDGRIILKQPVEDLLSQAYTVSGEAAQVERFIEGKRCVSGETLGKFRAVTVMECLQNSDRALARELELDLSGVELQKLFISLTNS